MTRRNNTFFTMMLLSIVLIFLSFVVAKSKIEHFDIFPKIPNVIEYSDNELCKNESKLYQENLKNETLWAYKMLDASAKDTFGILEGNNYQFGSYDECLDLIGPFPTQYCLISLTINAPVINSSTNLYYDLSEKPYNTFFEKLQKPKHNRLQKSDTLAIGLCLPASCSAPDIQSSLRETLRVTETPFGNKNVTYDINSNSELCVSQIHPKTFGIGETLFCVFSVILILLVFFSTVVDFMCKQDIDSGEEEPRRMTICLSFSAKRTWNDLFQSRSKETNIFSGVKTISIVLVVFGHKGIITVIGPLLNGEALDHLSRLKFGVVADTLSLSVDSFFFMSGLFLSYGMMKMAENAKKNPLTIIFLRYVRLTPLIAYVSFYSATILNLTGSGPVWNMLTKPTADACKKTWWWNILYISNYLTNALDVCIISTWYSSCDFQLFIIGVLVMLLIRKNRQAGYAVLMILFIGSVVTSCVIIKVYQLPPFLGIDNDYGMVQFFNLFYSKPYTHGFSYMVGMLGGIVYHHFKSNKTKLSKKLSYSIICISTCLMVVSPGCSYFFYGRQKYSDIAVALFVPLYRLFWSIGILGICTVASFGPFVSLRSFLSSSIWIPLSKLSFGVFLIHLAIIIPGVAGTFVVIRPTVLSVITSLFGEILLSFIAAFFLYIFVESPTLKVFKLLLLDRYTPVHTNETHVRRSSIPILDVRVHINS